MLTGVDPSVTSIAIRVGVVVLAGYLLGSVPAATLVARRRGVSDLRVVGDGNPGYWNAKETLGRSAALPVFLLDAAKGALSAGIGAAIATDGQWWMAYVGAAAAMVGHAWPMFAGFRGGRSVLAFAGGICVAAPLPAAAAIGLLLVVLAATRSFAFGARAGIFGLPVIQFAIEGRYRTAATGALMCLFGLRFVMAWRAAAQRDGADPAGQSAEPRTPPR
jgi:acyl phosphate:glycerol-3-phosphate acyltransferase